jgi:uncharacterized protein (TIRG00374 family)
MKARLGSFWRSTRHWLPGVLISIVLLVVVFRLARWQDLKVALEAVRPLNLIIAIALTIISLFTRAFAWRTLLDNRPPALKTFLVINEGYFLNNIFPLRAGEIGRALFMGQTTGFGPFHVLSTIIIERAFDLVMAACLILATLPLALGMVWARPVAIITLVLVILGLAGLYAMARFREAVRGFILRLGKRWPVIARVIEPQLDKFLEGLGVLTSPTRFLITLFWIALSWVIWVFLYYVMLVPIAPQAPLWWAAFADGVLAIGIAVPSAPSGLGVFEAALVGALTLLGVNASSALAYAILMHFLQFVVTGILGFIGLTQEGRSLSSLFSEIRVREEAPLS